MPIAGSALVERHDGGQLQSLPNVDGAVHMLCGTGVLRQLQRTAHPRVKTLAAEPDLITLQIKARDDRLGREL